jgi:hypothetical protein
MFRELVLLLSSGKRYLLCWVQYKELISTPSVSPNRIGIFTWEREQSQLLKRVFIIELDNGWSPEKLQYF